ncbi:MAG: class I SAM-dependent methyltransferase [Desulfotignum sp.]|nr:class I SAM-dependent methyltransferase [Desulfotignum sp.]MCF8137264.1 class I SAM-dependent methyltransferase [Desulfotignum sp.]
MTQPCNTARFYIPFIFYPFIKAFAMESFVRDHYHAKNLLDTIDAGLTAAGKDLKQLAVQDLAPVDQLHTGGIRGTTALLEQLDIPADFRVLDAGCGLGGTCRVMAKTCGCDVTGIDLSPDYIEAARVLTHRTGLAARVQFETGSILALPDAIGLFDLILCQHILMNISDKQAAIHQFVRHLKPKGKIILHEIVAGSHPDLAWPVPWAASADISFLEPWETLLACFTDTGFQLDRFTDATAIGCRYWQKAKEFALKNADIPRALGPHLVFGDMAARFPFTMSQNFDTRAIKLVEAVLTRH